MPDAIAEFTTTPDRIPIRIDEVDYELRSLDEYSPAELPKLMKLQSALQGLAVPQNGNAKAANAYAAKVKQYETQIKTLYQSMFVDWSEDLQEKLDKLGWTSQLRLINLVFGAAAQQAAPDSSAAAS